MTSQSTAVAGSLFRVDCQRPPVPGSGGIRGNDLATASKSSFISEPSQSFLSEESAALSTPWTVTSPTPHGPCLPQEPDGCSSKMAVYPEISEPGLSKRDVLISLLNDRHGVTYFRQFLSTKHACDILEFWLACVGYRKIETVRRSSFASVIYKTFVVSAGNRVCLAGTTRRAIKEKLKLGNVDQTTFDSAVAEVETVLLRDYYPLFLESDDYAEYVRTRSANQSPSSDGSSGNSSSCSQLQTFDEGGSQHCNDRRSCKENVSATVALKDPKTFNQLSSDIQCTGDCLAQTGYVLFILCFICLPPSLHD